MPPFVLNGDMSEGVVSSDDVNNPNSGREQFRGINGLFILHSNLNNISKLLRRKYNSFFTRFQILNTCCIIIWHIFSSEMGKIKKDLFYRTNGITQNVK